MSKKLCWLTLLAILTAVLLLGCGEQGKVDESAHELRSMLAGAPFSVLSRMRPFSGLPSWR